MLQSGSSIQIVLVGKGKQGSERKSPGRQKNATARLTRNGAQTDTRRGCPSIKALVDVKEAEHEEKTKVDAEPVVIDLNGDDSLEEDRLKRLERGHPKSVEEIAMRRQPADLGRKDVGKAGMKGV
ncbi:MAG: hypothetical protein M1836_004720 [Candelina mexicana]|nr:MAG: hypothetical protein M1836_004720 [Candelina mexicana]